MKSAMVTQESALVTLSRLDRSTTHLLHPRIYSRMCTVEDQEETMRTLLTALHPERSDARPTVRPYGFWSRPLAKVAKQGSPKLF